jgi:hypothetical protein
MKALSIHQPWASLVAVGAKTIEVRTWSASHRGPLIICSTVADFDLDDGDIAPGGYALAVVNLVDVRPMTTTDLEKAHLGDLTKKERAAALRSLAWVFEDAREIVPVPVKGKQGLFELDIPLEPLPADIVAWGKETGCVAHIEYMSRLRAKS